MGEVVNFQAQNIGEGYRLDADVVLDEAKGNAFDRILIVGQMEDGEFYIAGNANAGESLILLERVKDFIVHG